MPDWLTQWGQLAFAVVLPSLVAAWVTWRKGKTEGRLAEVEAKLKERAAAAEATRIEVAVADGHTDRVIAALQGHARWQQEQIQVIAARLVVAEQQMVEEREKCDRELAKMRVLIDQQAEIVQTQAVELRVLRSAAREHGWQLAPGAGTDLQHKPLPPTP